MMNKQLYMMALLTLSACGNDGVDTMPASKANTGFEILATQPRSEQKDSFCADFNLTQTQAAVFFNRGKEIDATTMHDNYDWLNCYVEGKLNNKTLGFENCTYSIQAGGTANIVCEEGKAYLWACDSCDDLLRGAD